MQFSFVPFLHTREDDCSNWANTALRVHWEPFCSSQQAVRQCPLFKNKAKESTVMSIHYCSIMVCQLLMRWLFFSIKASICIAHTYPPAVPKIMLSQLKIFMPGENLFEKNERKWWMNMFVSNLRFVDFFSPWVSFPLKDDSCHCLSCEEGVMEFSMFLNLSE